MAIALALLGCAKNEDDAVESHKYGTETVRNEQFIVAFSEGGQLEAVESLKVEAEMDGSSTIVFVVDEGSTVKGPQEIQAKAGDTPESLAAAHKVTVEALRHVNPDLDTAIAEGQTVTIPGDLLVELDPGSLKDKILSQEIAVRTAKNAVTKAENDLEIQKLRNEQDIDDAQIVLRFAKLDLEKFLKSDSKNVREKFADNLLVLSNSVAISEEKLVFQRQLAERKFLANMALREEENKAMKTRHEIKQKKAEAEAYEKYDFPKQEQTFQSEIKKAELNLTTVQQTATNNMISSAENVNTAKQKHTLEEEKLVEVKDQLNKSKIYAPGSGLVVYHVSESRYGSSSQPIEKGATLRKGQDIIHLPDLSQMQVALKIHESRIRQVKPGLKVQVRIDTVPDRSFNGEISYVAPVASAAERWGSNKKVFKCQVSITDPLPAYVRPGASATCLIYVAKLEKMVKLEDGKQVKTLKVPIQSVVTTTEGRKVCFKVVNGQEEAVPVETGFYDQTHIQITKGLAEGDTILKAPLLRAKELNVGGGLFGYQRVNPEDLKVELPVTREMPSTKTGPQPKAPPKTASRPKSPGKQPEGGSKSGKSGSRRGSLMDLDKDGDGKVSKVEFGKLDERAKTFMGDFSSLDTNGDGGISKDEADAFRRKLMERFQKMRQSGGGGE